jgi:hypothetical protein
MSIRVAFGCQARVGKDTAVSYLLKKYPGSVHLSFAKALYDIQYNAQKVCGFPQLKDRSFLQWVGTEWARGRNPNVWVNIVEREIKKVPEGTSIFISDLRFPNEMEMLKRNGFKNVRIIRDCPLPLVSPGAGAHASETALESLPLREWDYVVYNDGRIPDFQFKLKEMAKTFESEILM